MSEQSTPFGHGLIGKPSGDGALIKDTSTAAFMRDVVEESKRQPVLIDFWAPWCGPCKQLTPLIERAVTNAKGRVKLVKMNIDEHPEVPGQMGIQSIPAVIAFKDGKPVDGFMGAIPESQIKTFIDKVAGPAGPTPEEEYIAQAEHLMGEGAFEEAAGLFSAVLQMDPGNITALAGLARAALGLRDGEQAKQILAMIPEESRFEAAVRAALADLELFEKATDTGEIDALAARLEADPNDHETRFELAIALNAARKREEAAAALLEIFRRDRSWNDDGARKELLKFFESWGPKDPATLTARRRLSSLMFS
ncbi:MAG: thioredoxin [Rhizobiales bacterium]|nr:thioredoxin [Hyphomicrobiales bacterium]